MGLKAVSGLRTRREGEAPAEPQASIQPAFHRCGSAGASPSRASKMLPAPHARAGLTIYEVFLALTLLLGSLAVLSQHIAVGRRAAVQGQLQTRAALLCETKLAEVLSGIEPMTAVSSMPIADAGEGWTWSLEVAAGPTEDLLNIAVTAAHTNDRGETDASLTVRRLARDPQVFLDTGTDESGSEGESP